MVYSEKEFKLMEEKYKIQIKKLQGNNDLKDKEIRLLKKQIKQSEEVIHDMDKNNYREECIALKEENRALKKS